MLLALSLGWKPPIGVLLTILIVGTILLFLLRYFGLINTRYVSVGLRALFIGCFVGVFIIWLTYRPPARAHRLALFPLQPASASTQPEGLGFGVTHTAVDLLRLSLPSGTRVSPIDAVEQAIDSVMEDGYRTYDIMSEGMTKVGTDEMGDRIVGKIR